MNTRNILVTPIFISVTALLILGAIGEVIVSMIRKINFISKSETASYEQEVETAHQLK